MAEADLRQYALACPIGSADDAYEAQPGSGDGLLLANPMESDPLPEAVLALVEQAQAAGTVVLPVALGRDRRRPPAPIDAVRSYDVPDRLAQRSLPASAHCRSSGRS